jgi:hypothetical protein
MCRIRFAIFAILVGFCTAADIASADKAEASTALHAGRHVALTIQADHRMTASRQKRPITNVRAYAGPISPAAG